MHDDMQIGIAGFQDFNSVFKFELVDFGELNIYHRVKYLTSRLKFRFKLSQNWHLTINLKFVKFALSCPVPCPVLCLVLFCALSCSVPCPVLCLVLSCALSCPVPCPVLCLVLSCGLSCPVPCSVLCLVLSFVLP